MKTRKTRLLTLKERQKLLFEFHWPKSMFPDMKYSEGGLESECDYYKIPKYQDMKTRKILGRTLNSPKYVVGVPAGPIESMEASWAEDWINIYDNGCIGWAGGRMPTKEEKTDIRKRISKLQDLLNERQKKLQEAWYLMGG